MAVHVRALSLIDGDDFSAVNIASQQWQLSMRAPVRLTIRADDLICDVGHCAFSISHQGDIAAFSMRI